MKKTKNACKILDKITGDDINLRKLIAKEKINADVARLIYEARTAADLSQAELAKLVGTQQSVIARLEDADYQGHSLTMLTKIAAACNQTVQISFSDCKDANMRRSEKNNLTHARA